MPDLSTNRLAAFREGVRRALFPTSPGEGRGARSGKTALLAAIAVALAVVLQLARLDIGNALESLWAEDGPILLQGAFDHGLLESLTSPYAGYLILVPRLIGEVGAAVPLRDASAAIAIASTLVVALCGLVVSVAAAGHVRNPYMRGALVALTVLSPVASLESIADGSYVLWYMLFASFWVLLWTPRSAGGAALGGAFVLLTGLSTPGLWFFAPLAGLRLLAARDRRDGAILGGYAIGAAVQVPVLASNSETAVEPLWTNDIWTSYLQRVLDGGVLGERLGGLGWEQLGWALLGILVLATLAALGWVAWRSSTAVRAFVALAVGTSLLMFVASVYQRAVGAQVMWPAGTYFGNAGRYAIVPALLLASAALVAIDRWPRPLPGPRHLPWAGLAAVLLAALAIGSSFHVADPAVRGTPHWSEAIDSAAATCRREGDETAPVNISPPGYALFVKCERLSDASR
ncbi:MAG TPA: hypothetical protein VKB23_10685 [Solirubrobacterales bacterium]|nr:hypothetical protein [Solirubrobacterales bacterium]